jgi:hypothetical protein
MRLMGKVRQFNNSFHGAVSIQSFPRGGAILTLQSGATPAFAAKGDFFLQRTAPAAHQPLTHHRRQAENRALSIDLYRYAAIHLAAHARLRMPRKTPPAASLV